MKWIRAGELVDWARIENIIHDAAEEFLRLAELEEEESEYWKLRGVGFKVAEWELKLKIRGSGKLSELMLAEDFCSAVADKVRGRLSSLLGKDAPAVYSRVERSPTGYTCILEVESV